jgi:hypothetical protein
MSGDDRGCHVRWGCHDREIDLVWVRRLRETCAVVFSEGQR